MTMEIIQEEGEMFVSASWCEADLVTFYSGAENCLKEIVGLC